MTHGERACYGLWRYIALGAGGEPEKAAALIKITKELEVLVEIDPEAVPDVDSTY